MSKLKKPASRIDERAMRLQIQHEAAVKHVHKPKPAPAQEG